jgi:hypothetical protein
MCRHPNLENLETIKRHNKNKSYAMTIVSATTCCFAGTLYIINARATFSIDAASSSLLLLTTFIFIYNIIRRPSIKGNDITLSSLSRVTSVDTFKNLSKNLLSSLDCSNSLLRSAIQSITRKECFARLDYIEQLSINDITILFRYATDANLYDFEKNKFIAEQTQIVKAVITALDMAVRVSRGCLSEGTAKILSTSEKRSEGNIDALRFVAVTRIFAEWRNLRMVPKGYQRYAMGLSLAYRDVLQNLEKIERGVHEYLIHYQTLNKERKSPTTPMIPSPTLRQLLQFELEMKVHKKFPFLKEKSSASGLLWTKRQLHYQLATFGNSLEVPEYYTSPKDAASAAYKIVYHDYHGWAIKHIFSQSFGGSPPIDKIWLYICPPKYLPRTSNGGKQQYKATSTRSVDDDDHPPPARKLSDVTSSCTTSQISSSSSVCEEDSAASTMEEDDDNEFLVAMEKIGGGIVEKWEDILRMFNCGKEEKKKRKNNLILSSESHFNLNQLNTDMVGGGGGSSSFHNPTTGRSNIITTDNDNSSIVPGSPYTVSSSIEDTVIENSKRDVADFVRNVSPMVADLGKLIDELNMNDPTKA